MAEKMAHENTVSHEKNEQELLRQLKEEASTPSKKDASACRCDSEMFHRGQSKMQD